MPKTQKDTNKLLNILATFISNKCKIKTDELLNDSYLFDGLIEQHMDWAVVASQCQLSRHELYRWYHDTYQRNLYGQVSAEDRIIIKNAIEDAILSQIPLDKKFQNELKGKLSTQYHRNSFTVTFNNCKRLASQRTKKNMLDLTELVSILQNMK